MRPTRSLGREDGQAAVELALVLPVLITLFLAIVQFGIVFHHYLVLTDAVGTGARQAAVSRSAADPAAAAKQAVLGAATGLDAGRLDVRVETSWEAGADAAVTATYPYAIEIFGVVVRDGVLTARTIARIE